MTNSKLFPELTKVIKRLKKLGKELYPISLEIALRRKGITYEQYLKQYKSKLDNID